MDAITNGSRLSSFSLSCMLLTYLFFNINAEAIMGIKKVETKTSEVTTATNDVVA